MSLLAANFAFNRIFSERVKIGIWLVDVMLFSNVAIITCIMANSGGHLSYFWVLYLLPIFTAALAGRTPEVAITTALCVLALGSMSLKPARAEMAEMFAFFVKASVFIFSALVTYHTSLTRRRLETGMSFKRFQVEKLMALAARRDAEAQLDASAAEVGRMTASLLHDIGNIVSIILMSSEIMVKEETPNPKDLKRVHQAARMAKSIINGSLALIKGVRYEFLTESLKDPMENAAAIFIRQARGKGVKLSVSVEEGLPNVKMSVPHIQRVFINAIVNSLSFLKPGGAITLKAVRAGGAVRVSIEDNGPGFPPEMLKRGIAAFGTTRKDKGGTGLGLFNSKEIVENHGGELSIRNRKPSGAVVEFTLPIAGPTTLKLQ
jgi:signal transduction histidine kinase